MTNVSFKKASAAFELNIVSVFKVWHVIITHRTHVLVSCELAVTDLLVVAKDLPASFLWQFKRLQGNYAFTIIS